ncbi:bestrophin family protein [Hymenobacter psychrotolerans]|uniref:Putative membrane protein n=1 Tax=Hymenobacter psychrotolerans DSM 18569 TaxID=1121959 RepID=A0A1M6ZRF9_9BACT|nr:bestrophin family ion channel [Hymenobacter psychrotolerans]SHL33036.1 putative membrane protein [Hymenobacter psychrotolerans DSM 18569]
MYVQKNIHWRVIWNYSWKDLLIFFMYDLTLAILHGPLGMTWLDIPWQMVSILGVAVSFYVGFKNSSSYNRFNEARQLWGGIVNRSRSWTMLVLANTQPSRQGLTPEQVSTQRQLVYRQIAWVNALRLHLRRQPQRWDEDVAPFLDAAESGYLRTAANPPAQLLLVQTQALRHAEGLFDPLQHRTLVEDLRELTNLQGGCERIKNTPFPRQYAFSSIVFVWLFVALLPLGVQGEFEKLGHGHYWLTVPFSVLVSWVFVTIELVGHISENPFENKMNDVPMTALCRTIEIDLRQMLGETNLPAPLQPHNSVLY